MQRLLLTLTLAFCLALSGCDSVLFVGVSDGNSNLLVATGTVSLVQFTVVDGTTFVTIVTLVDGGFGNDFTFCGDLRQQFPLDAPVRVTFVPGTTCDSNVVVVLV